MFGISFTELILIVIIAVVVFGPEQLPVIAQKIGQTIAYFRNSKQQITQQLYEQLNIDELNNLKTELIHTVDSIRQNLPNTPNHQYDEYINEHHHYPIFYQPEFDFDAQPELFDE